MHLSVDTWTCPPRNHACKDVHKPTKMQEQSLLLRKSYHLTKEVTLILPDTHPVCPRRAYIYWLTPWRYFRKCGKFPGPPEMCSKSSVWSSLGACVTAHTSNYFALIKIQRTVNSIKETLFYNCYCLCSWEVNRPRSRYADCWKLVYLHVLESYFSLTLNLMLYI